MEKANKRKSSVARKMAGLLIVLGLITALMCFLNVLAYDVLEGYNVTLNELIVKLQNSSDTSAVVAEINDLMGHINLKISGTYIFDIILLVVAVIVMVVSIIVSFRMIVTPTKKVSSTLEEIVTSIQNNEGDLTARVNVKNNDEIGQLAADINNFVELLQSNMLTMRASADQLQKSMDVVTDKVEASNGSVTNVSPQAVQTPST